MLQIHKASAGSGKTYTLTRQYLQLLLGEKITEGPGAGSYRLRPLSSYGPGKPKHHGSILAVTFTNKATEEMISRIIGELAALSGDNPGQKSPYLDYFLETFGTDPETLARHAATALRDLLFNYSQFNVSTIDSFSSACSTPSPASSTSPPPTPWSSTTPTPYRWPWPRCSHRSISTSTPSSSPWPPVSAATSSAGSRTI